MVWKILHNFCYFSDKEQLLAFVALCQQQCCFLYMGDDLHLDIQQSRLLSSIRKCKSYNLPGSEYLPGSISYDKWLKQSLISPYSQAGLVYYPQAQAASLWQSITYARHCTLTFLYPHITSVWWWVLEVLQADFTHQFCVAEEQREKMKQNKTKKDQNHSRVLNT